MRNTICCIAGAFLCAASVVAINKFPQKDINDISDKDIPEQTLQLISQKCAIKNEGVDFAKDIYRAITNEEPTINIVDRNCTDRETKEWIDTATEEQKKSNTINTAGLIAFVAGVSIGSFGVGGIAQEARQKQEKQFKPA